MFGRIDWHPSAKKVRHFAITLLIVVVLAALLMLAKGRAESAQIVAAVGTVLALISYLIPLVGKLIYLLWMAVTFVLGRIFSPILIGVIFFLVITPMGLITRLIGRDTLKLKRNRAATSYFVEMEKVEQNSFERQF